MRVSSAQIFTQGLNVILDQQSGLAKTQLQIATGRRILTPADDPAGAKRALDLDEAIELARQLQLNADTAASRLALEDTVLDQVTSTLQRIRELIIQGNTATLTATDRDSIARELEQRLEALLADGNSQDGNHEFLFAGFSSRTQPFAAVASGGFSYSGDQGSRQIRIGPSLTVNDADPGSRVFMEIRNGNGTFRTASTTTNLGSGVIDAGTVTDPASWVPDTYTIAFTAPGVFEVRDGAATLIATGNHVSGAAIAFNGIQVSISGQPNVGDTFAVRPSVNQDMFSMVREVVDAFRASTSDGAAQAQLHNAAERGLINIDQALENVRAVRARVGARLNLVDDEKSLNADFEVQLRTDLSRVQDADLAVVITALNQQLATLQAAHQSFAQVQSLSLFNFI